MLLDKYSELKARKERVDRITELLLTLKSEDDVREALEGSKGEAPPTQPAHEAGASQGAAKSSRSVRRGPSELVMGDDDLPPEIEELQKKLR
jgi:hypothetical protein